MMQRLQSSRFRNGKYSHDDETKSTAVEGHPHRDEDDMQSVRSESESIGRRIDGDFQKSIRCFRVFIVILMITATASAVLLTHDYLSDQQNQSLKTEVRVSGVYMPTTTTTTTTKLFIHIFYLSHIILPYQI